MKFYGKAETAATAILKRFQEPDTLPEALAPMFIRRRDNVPCRSWSWCNQMLVAIHGHSDARGFRQWQEVGRNVQKGEKSFAILVPLARKIEKENDRGETEAFTALYGFKSAAVFGLTQTEGDPLPPPDEDVTRWLESLPLLDVARSWGLDVDAYNGRQGAAQGKYVHGLGIALGVQNLSTWTHELMHAADDRLGKLTAWEPK